jgi:diaminopimelate epimerase
VNVEFIKPEEDGSVSMRVWERGVGETMACGTGGTAVGAAAVRLGLARSPVTVHLLGGDLEIEVGEDWEVTMTGPAEEVFTGTLSQDLLARLSKQQHP